jgi:hypothetical protein
VQRKPRYGGVFSLQSQRRGGVKMAGW